jgi:hypothetical protein
VRATVVYITGRKDPRLDWTVADLDQQIQPKDEIHLIVVDTLGRSLGQLGVNERSTKLKSAIVTPPKPNIWQGRHRVTSADWWAKSSASNTALVLCKTDFVAFLDDRCRLGPRWLETVRRAERERDAVVVGTYDKIELAGKVTVDHRRERHPDGKRNCGGGWLYGCTFALPRAWCLEANGFEEGCDGLSGEDYIFGFMLENNGHRIDFDPSLFVTLERSPSHGSTYIRVDKGKSPNDKSHAAIARFKNRKRTEFTPDLTALRADLARGGSFPIPDPKGDYRDWYDGTLIKDAR